MPFSRAVPNPLVNILDRDPGSPGGRSRRDAIPVLAVKHLPPHVQFRRHGKRGEGQIMRNSPLWEVEYAIFHELIDEVFAFDVSFGSIHDCHFLQVALDSHRRPATIHEYWKCVPFTHGSTAALSGMLKSASFGRLTLDSDKTISGRVAFFDPSRFFIQLHSVATSWLSGR